MKNYHKQFFLELLINNSQIKIQASPLASLRDLSKGEGVKKSLEIKFGYTLKFLTIVRVI